MNLERRTVGPLLAALVLMTLVDRESRGLYGIGHGDMDTIFADSVEDTGTVSNVACFAVKTSYSEIHFVIAELVCEFAESGSSGHVHVRHHLAVDHDYSCGGI